MKRIITLSIVFLLFFGKIYSQKLQYENDSKWFWGLNAGVAWQTTDVTSKNNYGYGFMLGRSFNYDYGKGISFDIRARYLRGYWLGQDLDSTQIGADYNGVLSQIGTDYKDSFGITVNNFQADVHRLGLELVLHANGIRERSGWDPYIFGGIGFTWYQTYGDLKNNNSLEGQLYDYQNTPLNSASISAMLDNTYDTPLDGSNAIMYNVGFMPSLGFGLGYQLSKRVSIGIEHKTTFTRTDNFDGFVQTGTFKQDFYHYTSGYLRFQIKARGTTDETHHVDPIPDPVAHTPQPPVVTYITPSAPGTVVTAANYTVVANIKYVNSWGNITFKQDGVENSNFTFNTSTQRFESNVVLHTGQNNFEIKGTNLDGSDVELTHVIYQRDAGTPPVVTITNPATSPANVTNPQFNFSATVLNVQNQSQVKMTFNGQNFPNFVFNATTGGLTTPLTLIEGTNTIIVTGTNTFGTDSKTATIVYTKPQALTPPVVTYVNPSLDPYTTQNQSYNVVATVTNVSQSGGIKVSLNGTNITNFVFTPSTTKVTFTASLIEGANVIVITGTNTAGVDAENQTIVYNKPVTIAPPVVTFISPAVDPYTSTTQLYNVVATVTNVTVSSGINVTLNGTAVTNFTFNPTSTMVSFSASLIEGANVIVITGTNTAGVDTENQTIVYTKPVVVLPPVVTFVTPSLDPHTTNTQVYNVSATVTNVSSTNSINVKLNGSNITNFTFNPITTMVTFTASLIEGANTVTIMGTNTAGTDTEDQTIIYNKPVVVLPPVVTYITPSVDPFTTNTQIYNVSATATNVAASNGISVKLNGSTITNFTFNPATMMVAFTASLIEGNNVIVITGTNTAGTDTENQTIIYNKPVTIIPPVVTFLNPASATFVTVKPFTMIATVMNVDNKSQITVSKDGQIIDQASYTFDAATKKVSFNTSLDVGVNEFIVTGTNTAGTDSKTAEIAYREQPVACDKPVITMINPAISNNTNEHSTFYASASMAYIISINQIQFKVNGIAQSGGVFNPQTNMFTNTIELTQGNNVIDIIATNDCGTVKESRSVKYVPCVAPTIQAILPNQMQTETEASLAQISATVNNVSSKDQIIFEVNGINQAFNYDQTSHIVSASANLAEGQNNLSIVVVTDCGTTNYAWIIKKSSCKLPVITVLTSTGPHAGTTNIQLFELTAKIENIATASQITVKYNGAPIAVVYDAQTKVLKINQRLAQGMNKFVIEAKNDCGQETKPHNVNFTTNQDVNNDVPHITVNCPQTAVLSSPVVITGSVTGATSASQVVIKVNGQVQTAINPSVVENALTFQFTITTAATATNYTIEVVATNVFGTDTKTCSFATTAAPAGTGGGKATGGKTTGTGTTPKPGTTGTGTTPPTPAPTSPPTGKGGK